MSRLTPFESIDTTQLSFPENTTIGIVVAQWNAPVTQALLEGAESFFEEIGIPASSKVDVIQVPGSFELPLGAQKLAMRSDIAAVLCLGCVIQGETRHFDYVCHSTAQGILDVGLKFNKPVIFGVLTTHNLQEAQDRAGGIHGNKGREAAISALSMLALG